jgi:hypothetical protein
MSKLNISDPSYAQVYFRVLTLDLLIAEVFKWPRKVTTLIGNKDCRTMNVLDSESTQLTPQRGTTSMNTKHSSPPTTTPPFTCFGCGSHQHQLRECAPIQDLVTHGELVYDRHGRVIIPHSQGPLRREPGENLLAAYYRTKGQADEQDAA